MSREIFIMISKTNISIVNACHENCPNILMCIYVSFEFSQMHWWRPDINIRSACQVKCYWWCCYICRFDFRWVACHYDDVIMGVMASQITSLMIVYSTVYSGADQSKHQSSASLAFVLGIHRGPVKSPHKWPVTRKMFPLDDVIMAKPCK